MPTLLLTLLLTGACAGILSGLLGIGGGIIVIPTLAYLFEYTDHQFVPMALTMPMAVASSLTAVLFISVMSTYVHHSKGSVRWDIWLRWVIGICLGALVGSYFLSLIDPRWLRACFGIFLLLIVAKFLFEGHAPTFRIPQNTTILFLLGISIGILSSLLGVGGGILMIPILTSLGCSLKESAGTSSATMIPLGSVAAINFIVTGYQHHIAIPWATGYIYWPAVILISATGMLFASFGVKLAYYIPTVWVKRFLAVLLFFVAIDMLV